MLAKMVFILGILFLSSATLADPSIRHNGVPLADKIVDEGPHSGGSGSHG